MHKRTNSPVMMPARWKTCALAASMALSACGGGLPIKMGDEGAKTVATGSAGGANAQGANPQLEKCDSTLGTIAVVEDQQQPWFAALSQNHLGSTTPVLRMMIQQSNCFLVVERGRGMNAIMQERALAKSGEARDNSNFGGGQLVAADYTLEPSVTISAKGTGGVGGAVGGLGLVGAVAGLVAAGLSSNEASTTLLMIDNRSGIQMIAAEGSAKNYDFSVAGGLFGGGGFGALGAYSNTPQGKVLVAAFMDSYNQVVKAARNYKAQKVKGGAGTGGALGVDGGTTAASRQLNGGGSAPASAPATPPAGSAPVAGANGTSMTLAQAQAKLNALGFPVGNPDGAMGGKTRAQLSAFQKSRGIAVTGKLDAATVSELAK